MRANSIAARWAGVRDGPDHSAPDRHPARSTRKTVAAAGSSTSSRYGADVQHSSGEPSSPAGRHLVVAILDRSPHGDVAVQPAFEIALRLNADLVLAATAAGDSDQIRDHLDAVAAQLPMRDVACELLPLERERLTAWLRVRGDPIVCVSRGRYHHRLADMVLGVYAGPAVMVPEHQCHRPTNRLVVHLDGTESADDVLGAAAVWARALRVPLRLVAVAPYPVPEGLSQGGLELLYHGYLATRARSITTVDIRDWEVLHDRRHSRGLIRLLAPGTDLLVVTRRQASTTAFRLATTDRKVLRAGPALMLALPTGG